MKFSKTKIAGAYIIELEKKTDERGFLTRIWSKDEFLKHGINLELVQGYTSFTEKKGTLRGIHYRKAAPLVAQLTRCLKGAIYEVILDLRSDSPTFKKWVRFEIKANEYKMLLVPEGCAHAILTSEDNTLFLNLYTQPYDPLLESGIKYNDPLFNIKWPIPVKNVSDKDKSWEDYK